MVQETVLNNPETPSHARSATGVAAEASTELEIDFIEIAGLLLREKKTILGFVVVSVVLMAVVVFGIMRPMYSAEAIFLPPQAPPGSSLMQLGSQLGALSSMGGLGGLKSPGDVYVGILESRTIADSLIRQFDLQRVYKKKKLSDTVNQLHKRSTFISGKDTLIRVSVEDHDPQRAANLANGYIDALREQNGRLALTEAAQRRLFFQEQLEREKNALADAEVELKKTEEQTGLIAPAGQAQVAIEATSQIRAQIASRQVELAAVRQGATDENPQVVRLQTEINGLEQQLQKMENDPRSRTSGSVQMPTAKVPELALQYVRKLREVKYHEMLFELISKQYESARMDESRDAPLLQVVDRAVIPDRRSGPPRALLMAASLVLGAFLGIAWVGIKYILRKLMSDPMGAMKSAMLQKAVSLER
jgi:tyrosine-protein kinase Etk/Wzc